MNHFGRDLNQRGDDLIPGQFQMLFCLARRKLDATMTSQVSISLTINSPPWPLIETRDCIPTRVDS